MTSEVAAWRVVGNGFEMANPTRIAAVVTAVVMTAGLTIGCRPRHPSIELVHQDLLQIMRLEAGLEGEPVIHQSGPGEGDADGVYMHVRFDFKVEEAAVPPRGWFVGLSINRGEVLRGGEAILLYQWNPTEQRWAIANHRIESIPRRD